MYKIILIIIIIAVVGLIAYDRINTDKWCTVNLGTETFYTIEPDGTLSQAPFTHKGSYRAKDCGLISPQSMTDIK